jgi:hypothetical protein
MFMRCYSHDAHGVVLGSALLSTFSELNKNALHRKQHQKDSLK